jgi:hypothetical protein
MTIQRYFDDDCFGMVKDLKPSDNGDYVLYIDHIREVNALEKELVKLKAFWRCSTMNNKWVFEEYWKKLNSPKKKGKKK